MSKMAQAKAINRVLPNLKDRLDKIKKFNAFITTLDPTEQLEILNRSNIHDKETAGLTVALKDNFCTKNIRTTCGSRMLENFVPTYDCTVWTKLKSSGCVLLGKTNLDEFGMGSGTCDSYFGPTKNPWKFEESSFHITGGSSGGSAVAVATGVADIGIGSDTGGSVRNPASYCGVIGFKPTYGTISRHGLIPLVNSMDTPGIFTRTTEMCALAYRVLAGFDRMDSTSVDRPKEAPSKPVKLLRIGVPREYFCSSLSNAVFEKWSETAEALEKQGLVVKQVSLPHAVNSVYVYSILNQCEVASNMARYDGLRFGHRATSCDSGTEALYASSREQGLNGVVKGRILAGNYFLLRKNYQKYFEKALQVRRLIAQDFHRVFEDVDVLLTPTTLTTAPSHSDFVRANNRDQCAEQDFFTQAANMVGIPAMSVPVGLSSEGLPVGMQLMAPTFCEPSLFGVSQLVESIFEFRRNYEKVEINP